MTIADEAALEDELCRPQPALVNDAEGWSPRGLLILGAGGKMGVGIARMARRALDEAGRPGVPVTAVSRWSDDRRRQHLEEHGVTTLAADLADSEEIGRLPDAGEVVFLVGTKFGSSAHPDESWMTNTVLPALVSRRFRDSRFSALSTGNVYPFVSPAGGGPDEGHPTDPVGEYAITCLGREQVFRHASRTAGTRVSLIRLNYACEPRYGVLVDIARRVATGEAVDVGAGVVNVVWQRYANEVVLRALGHAAAPPFVLNLTGPETASVRALTVEIGCRLGMQPVIHGEEAATSLISNAMVCHELFGYPDRTLGQLVDMVCAWVSGGGTLWNKPTKFERRDGRF